MKFCGYGHLVELGHLMREEKSYNLPFTIKVGRPSNKNIYMKMKKAPISQYLSHIFKNNNFPLLDSVQMWLEQTSMIDKSSNNTFYEKWFMKSEGVAC